MCWFNEFYLYIYLFINFQIKLAITCSSETYQNANWSTTQTSQTANGTCIANYYGSPSRQCIQNGSNGIWNTNVTNPCQRMLF